MTASLTFRSALPRGERPHSVAARWHRFRFRSALPRGERPGRSTRAWSTASCFDPRSRAGSDCCLMVGDTGNSRFRSALPRGERRCATKTLTASVWFRSALPRGERRLLDTDGWATYGFDPRSRAGSDPLGSITTSASAVFRSALPRGERRHRRASRSARCRFRSALPRGERRARVLLGSAHWMFRSALPRGERPLAINRYKGERVVSIRAPARGATGRSARAIAVPGFDPRSRAGSDDGRVIDPTWIDAVSIRAPARGATPSPKALAITKPWFRSALPRGERLVDLV